MKHKTADLSGALLDAAVAKAEESLYELREVHGVLRCLVDGDYYEPASALSDCSGWCDAGPIIERERINVCYDDQGGRERGMWSAYIYDGNGSMWFGETPLIAAMRAFVASRFGDEVELP
jgi:hypothetical protein